jgi:NAD(P)-dependent dehydrogenase (short-subunit alcohol dehydrogenase family)
MLPGVLDFNQLLSYPTSGILENTLEEVCVISMDESLKIINMKTLEDKVVIITGAGSGIGQAAALLYAREGAKVVISDIADKHGNDVVAEIKRQGGEAFFIKADSSSAEDNKQLVDETVKKYGRLDIAVNNAGIGGPLGFTGDYPVDGWQKVINVNLSGVFYGMRYQIPAMLGRGGSIVNIASILGQAGTKGSPAYVAAKHGVVGLTKAAALEYADKNIRINSVGPGYIKTPLVMNSLDDAARNALVGLHPMGRLGESEEIAELILWLGSPKSSFVTGSYYPADGGYLAQ